MSPKKLKKILPIVDARGVADATLLDIRAKQVEEGQPITCPTGDDTLGCNGCCRGAIIVLDVELNQIKRAMDRHAWVRVRELAPSILHNEKRATCPLLDPDTGACSVYEVRPLACRLYAVVTPVDNCYPPERGQAEQISTPQDCAEAIDALGAMVIGTEDPRTLMCHTTTLSRGLVNDMQLRDAKKAAKRRGRK